MQEFAMTAEWLRKSRKACEITRAELAEMIFADDEAQIARMERGEERVPENMARALSRVFGAPADNDNTAACGGGGGVRHAA